MQRADDRQAADELRNQAVLDEILRLELLERRADVALRSDLTSALKPSVFLPMRRSIALSRPTNAPPQMKRMLRGVDLEELLVRMLASALRRNVGDRALEDLQQRLLHAFARDVAGDRRVLVLAADLVDFVDVDDALLALLDVVAGRLQQLEDDVLDVLADVAGLGQRRRVDDRERDRAGAWPASAPAASCRCRSDRSAGCSTLGQLDVVAAARLLLDFDALVVVVDRDGQLLLRAVPGR